MHCQLRAPSEPALSEPSRSTNPDLVGSRRQERGDLGSRWGETRKDCGVSPVRGRVSTPWARGAALTWPITASQEPVCPPVQPQLLATAGAQTPWPKVAFQVSVLLEKGPAHRVPRPWTNLGDVTGWQSGQHRFGSLIPALSQTKCVPLDKSWCLLDIAVLIGRVRTWW